MIDRLLNKKKEVGVFGLFLVIVRRTRVFKYLVVYYFYRASLSKISGHVDFPSNISTKVIVGLEGLSDLNKVNEKNEVFTERLKSSDKFAVVVYSESAPVGYVWGDLSTLHVEERFGFEVKLNPNDVYDFDSYIKPEFRGTGLRKYLLYTFVDYSLNDVNRHFITAIIEKDNKNSVQIHERMGYLRSSLHFAGCLGGKKLNYQLKNYS